MTLQRLELCIENLQGPMNKICRKLDDRNTKFIICSTKSKVSSIKASSVRVGIENIRVTKQVRNIGSYGDRQLKMNIKVKKKKDQCALFNLCIIDKIGL